MPVYTFPTNIAIGDLGQVTWANSVGAALNSLGPLVGNTPIFISGSNPGTTTYIQFKPVGTNGLVELWIEDGQ